MIARERGWTVTTMERVRYPRSESMAFRVRRERGKTAAQRKYEQNCRVSPARKFLDGNDILNHVC